MGVLFLALLAGGPFPWGPAALSGVVSGPLAGDRSACCAPAVAAGDDRAANGVAESQAPLSPPLETWSADPSFQMEDAYKWIFHATQGGEHALADAAGPRAWLDQEWETLGPPRPGEELQELLANGIVRLHLRPFKASGGVKSRLLASFMESARAFRADTQAFVIAWRALGERLRSSAGGGLTLQRWQTLDDRQRPLGYPAVHHSASYRERHRPAYRVLRHVEAVTLLGSAPPASDAKIR